MKIHFQRFQDLNFQVYYVNRQGACGFSGILTVDWESYISQEMQQEQEFSRK